MSKLLVSWLAMKCIFWPLVVVLSWLILLYNEYASYWLTPINWSRLHLATSHREQVLRILLVADPQIQGNQYEDRRIGIFSRWDIDRYLASTYKYAKQFVRPDIVIFLGDLFDEGSQATFDEYEEYYRRFQRIFPATPGIIHTYIPGDNDVGGEGGDVRNVFKSKRFNQHFVNDTGLINHLFLDIFKLNYNFGDSPSSITSTLDGLLKQSHGNIRFMINHMTLLDRMRRNYASILKLLGPDLIISAHGHTARIFKCQNCRSDSVGPGEAEYQGTIENVQDNSVHHFNLKDDAAIVELAVPTCSYRMGVPTMGYGAIMLGKSGLMSYTVLWTPPRLAQLYAHTMVLIVWAISVIAYVTPALYRRFCLQRQIMMMKPANLRK